MTIAQIICPGCALSMPRSDRAGYAGAYNASPECWSVYSEVLGAEFSNVLLFGQVHQLTVDTYAVQHAGGAHPDKSVCIHLCGLHLMLERGTRPTDVPKLFQRLAETVEQWPHFAPPTEPGSLTVCDVALVDSVEEHIRTVRAWADSLWKMWSQHHSLVAQFVTRHLIVDC